MTRGQIVGQIVAEALDRLYDGLNPDRLEVTITAVPMDTFDPRHVTTLRIPYALPLSFQVERGVAADAVMNRLIAELVRIGSVEPE